LSSGSGPLGHGTFALFPNVASGTGTIQWATIPSECRKRTMGNRSFPNVASGMGTMQWTTISSEYRKRTRGNEVLQSTSE
jgi:hypothetical protein